MYTDRQAGIANLIRSREAPHTHTKKRRISFALAVFFGLWCLCVRAFYDFCLAIRAQCGIKFILSYGIYIYAVEVPSFTTDQVNLVNVKYILQKPLSPHIK